MSLERFQEATVSAAVEALTRGGGSRRYLIADEVGLGKTVAAKAIAERLRAKRRRPLNVVYLCPNLEIAAQNLTKLAVLEPGWRQPEDRLSLVGAAPPDDSHRYRIYCYTPDTSLPGWRGGSRTGRAAERALIASLLARVVRRSWLRIRARENARVAEGLASWFPALPNEPSHLSQRFADALRQTLLLPGGDLDELLSGWLDSHDHDVPELILRSRAALALAALRLPACKPDLIILDEFHRYADLIIGLPEVRARSAAEQERHHVHQLLADALCGKGRGAAAMLLLSATPYRLHSVDRKPLPGGRYAHFVDVVAFLMGGAPPHDRAAVRAAIVAHHDALGARGDRTAALAEVARSKRALEALLKPFIARTERATDIEGELFSRIDQPAAIEPRDLIQFRHLARAAIKGAPRLTSWVQPLWSSIPYPAELLHGYKICSGLTRALPPVTIASEGGDPAHPRLRALVRPSSGSEAPLDPAALGLPWIAPTRPWWPCGGQWQLAGPAFGKTMIFSRYAGTPPSVSAWLSGEVDRTAARHQKSGAAFKSQAYLRPDQDRPWPIVAMFMPWPRLSCLIDPARSRHAKLADARAKARAVLRDALRAVDIRITARTGAQRKPWELAFALERKLGGQAIVDQAARQVLNRRRLEAWSDAGDVDSLSRSELVQLADWLLGSPGPVIARALRRHDASALDDSQQLTRAFRFCWARLRVYLGQRYFAAAILGQGRKARRRQGYPEALRQAVVEGGLEATLDEHLAVMVVIGDQTPIQTLEASVLGRPGRVRRRTTRRAGHARVHAAIPFVGADRRTGTGEDKLRSDAIRRAFNSPFWPHVISTTSVGQEGLDFHVWCDRIVHWDLPRDPVDFEQREGRIARYASLCVRRALADKHDVEASDDWRSPFARIFTLARDAPAEGLGLARWWAPPTHLPASITFNLPFSLGGVRLARLRDELLSYRLALGQPEPGRFEAMVKHFGLSQQDARALALNLSPARQDT